MSVSSDVYGAFWRCAQCGYHNDADVPQPPRIRRSEAAKASYRAFKYTGTLKHFEGYRLRGHLIRPQHHQTVDRFDLACPYAGCQRRQLTKVQQHGKEKYYQCAAKHRINLNLDELTWT